MSLLQKRSTNTAYFFTLLSEVLFILYGSHFHLTEWGNKRFAFFGIHDSIKPCSWICSFPIPPHPYHSLSFAFQPLTLPHLLSQEQSLLSKCLYLLIFLILNQIPLSGPMQPLHTVTKFLSPVHLLAVNWFSLPDGRVCTVFF